MSGMIIARAVNPLFVRIVDWYELSSAKFLAVQKRKRLE